MTINYRVRILLKWVPLKITVLKRVSCSSNLTNVFRRSSSHTLLHVMCMRTNINCRCPHCYVIISRSLLKTPCQCDFGRTKSGWRAGKELHMWCVGLFICWNRKWHWKEWDPGSTSFTRADGTVVQWSVVAELPQAHHCSKIGTERLHCRPLANSRVVLARYEQRYIG